MKLNKVLKKYNHKNFFFIEIGANDGKYLDPIWKYVKKYNWRGILVEPVPEVFERLKKNYEGRDVILENAAIGKRCGIKKMYIIDTEREGMPESFKGYARAISSFRKRMWLNKKRSSEMKKMFNEIVLPSMKEIMVDCTTLSSLMKKHGVEKVDLLQIDAEGYDYEILKTLDIKPKIVHYENMNLGKEKEECFKFMQDKGYRVQNQHSDTLCVLKETK